MSSPFPFTASPIPHPITFRGTQAIQVDWGNHLGQWQAWSAARRIVCILGGAQGGKTSFGPPWLAREMQQRGPGDALVVTPTFPLLELKLLPEFRRFFETQLRLGEYVSSPYRHFIFSEDGMRQLYGDAYDSRRDDPSRVLFGYAAEPQSLESLTGVCAWCDEAGQKKFSAAAWDAVLQRMSLSIGRVLITTKVYSLNWLQTLHNRYLAGDPTIDWIRFDSVANPGFPRAEWERAKRELPAWKFNMHYRALFERPPGLIYDCFNPDRHKVPRFTIPRHWRRSLGLDFGTRNTAATFWAQEPETNRLYCYREYHQAGESAQGHVRRLLHGEPGIPFTVGGSSSEGEWRTAFKQSGLPIRAPKIRDVEVGIDRVYGAFQRDEFYIFDDLTNLLDELNTYSRELDDTGAPTDRIEDKETFHLMDSLRYIIGDLKSPTYDFVPFIIHMRDPIEEMDHAGW